MQRNYIKYWILLRECNSIAAGVLALITTTFSKSGSLSCKQNFDTSHKISCSKSRTTSNASITNIVFSKTWLFKFSYQQSDSLSAIHKVARLRLTFWQQHHLIHRFCPSRLFESINRSTDRPTDRPIDRSIDRFFSALQLRALRPGISNDRSIHPSTNQSINQSNYW